MRDTILGATHQREQRYSSSGSFWAAMWAEFLRQGMEPWDAKDLAEVGFSTFHACYFDACTCLGPTVTLDKNDLAATAREYMDLIAHEVAILDAEEASKQ